MRSTSSAVGNIIVFVMSQTGWSQNILVGLKKHWLKNNQNHRYTSAFIEYITSGLKFFHHPIDSDKYSLFFSLLDPDFFIEKSGN